MELPTSAFVVLEAYHGSSGGFLGHSKVFCVDCITSALLDSISMCIHWDNYNLQHNGASHSVYSTTKISTSTEGVQLKP